MKSFDAASIETRMLEKLSQNPDWKAIVNDSVISAIVKAVSESNAEIARYTEYLYTESKWDTARNLSSITAQAGQLGYKPSRAKSSFGEIYISADPRIHLVGRQLYKNNFLGLATNLELIPNWATLTQDISFGSTVTITDSRGMSYIMTSSEPLANGKPYVKNYIMQGIQKIISIPIDVLRVISTRSKLDPYLYIPVKITDCENAGTPYSEPFFKVFVTYGTAENITAVEEYRVVSTLHLGTTADRDVEVFPDLYDNELVYLKFNTSPTRGKVISLSPGAGVRSVDIQYVETTGSEGNLTDIFEPFIITNITGYSNLTLYGLNLEAIVGGTDRETAYDIKSRAPTYYTETYTVANRESYEALIKRIDFDNKTYPDKVKVFPGLLEEEGITKSVTYVTLISSALEDKLSAPNSTFTYSDIEKKINYHLSRLKSPTDIIKFYPPNYIRIGIGVQCTAQRELVPNLIELKDSIKAAIESEYGARSTTLDFDRPIYESDIVSGVKMASTAILSVKTEFEAIQQLNWETATRIHPNVSSPIHTARLSFGFDPLFAGANYIKGFRDYRTGASYVLRFDILYKQLITSTLPSWHTSIFIKEDPTRTTPIFLHVSDKTDGTEIWGDPYYVSDDSQYPFNELTAGTIAELPDSYQFYYKKKIYSDDAFSQLISLDNLRLESALTDYTKTPGILSSFLIWFAGDHTPTGGLIGNGFIELDLSSIYSTLQRYAEQDVTLAGLLQAHPLANLRCDQSDTLFASFVTNVLSNYVDIYVSARPIDKDLIPSEDDIEQQSAVLYIDTRDENGTNILTENLSSDKKARFLSVEIDLV